MLNETMTNMPGRAKATVQLPKELLLAVDRIRPRHTSRSDFIEQAVRTFLTQRKREEQNARDLEIINQRADDLNQEAEDVLNQALWIALDLPD